ncbi:DUF1295 domain-containing protein [Alsobacter sp. R-9]
MMAAIGLTTGLGAALAALVVTVAVFAALWLYSLRREDCSVVDLYWGFGFAVIAWVEAGLVGGFTPARLVFIGLVTLWSLRLGIHLLLRHRAAEEEDARYAAMRQNDPVNWPRRSFWMVFMLQAVVMWLVASPVHMAVADTLAPEPATWLLVAGSALFVSGFALEAAADRQLVMFKADPANRGRLLTTGLFAWSRHPNYFGEAMLWWGLGLYAFALSGSAVALVGPALLTWLLMRVSGIPPLEAHLSQRPGFADYAARTSAFVPRPPSAPVAERSAEDRSAA